MEPGGEAVIGFLALDPDRAMSTIDRIIDLAGKTNAATEPQPG